MNSLERVWSQAGFSLSTKLRLYTSLVLSVLLYASETWTVNKADLEHLQTFHMRCQRRILGVRWFHKIRNTEIARRTSLPQIGDILQLRRHSLIGHVVRMEQQAPAHMMLRLCRDMTLGRRIPPGWKRPRGRPRTTWVGQLRKNWAVLWQRHGRVHRTDCCGDGTQWPYKATRFNE